MTTQIDGSGAPIPPQSGAQGDGTQNEGKVSYATHQRLLDEAKKAKARVAELEKKEADEADAKLKGQNEFKTLYEQTKLQLDSTNSTLQEQQTAINNGVKYSEFEKHLGGKLKDRDYATFVDFDKIVINPDTKTVDADSVKIVVADFLKKHRGLVQFTGTARLPNEAGSGGKIGPAKGINELSIDEIIAKAEKLAASGQLKE